MMNFRTAGALVLTAVSIPLAAEVYTLGSGTSGGGGALKQLGIVPGKPVHTEKVVSGKHSLSLEVYSVNQDFPILAGRLKQLNRSRASLSNGVIRCRTELQDKFVEHLLVINTGKNRQLVVFRLLLPPGFAGNTNWHPDLPDLPGGAKSELVLELPDRRAVFALFNNAFGSAQGNLRAVMSNLSGDWQITADESVMPNGRGAILIGKKNAVMLVGFSDDGSGFFYVKKSQ